MEEVRPGVWAVPIPAPGNPIRFTYCYVLQDEAGALVLDPGADTPESWAAMTAALEEIGVHRNIWGIVVSHFHFDHWQMADRLAAASGAWVAISQAEQDWISGITEADLSHAAARERFLDWGAPAEEAELLAETEDYGEPLEYVTPDLFLEDGDVVPGTEHRLGVLVTPGHSPGHLCLFDRERGVLFSGDHVLPGITPYVALNPFGPADPLGDYLGSLDRLRSCGDVEVLPAHEYRFAGLQARLTTLGDSVAARLSQVRAALAIDPGAPVWTVATNLTWSRSWDRFSPLSRRMALAETAAYMAHAAHAAGRAGRGGRSASAKC